MSAEITPAVERAERALVETWHGTIGRAFHPTRVKEARATLSAALDVEEMARELFVSDSEQDRDFALRVWFKARDDSPVKKLFRVHAKALRAALLGADS